MHVRVIHVAAVQRRPADVDDVAVLKDDVRDLLRPGFRSDLQSLAPVVPDHAVPHEDVPEDVVVLPPPVHGRPHRRLHVSLIIAVKALHADRVVEGPEEAVFDPHIPAVVHIDPVGVVPPAADDLHVPDRQTPAPDGADVVHQGIPDGDAVDFHVRAVFQLNGVLPDRVVHGGVVVLRIRFPEDPRPVPAVVEDPPPEDPDIVGIHGGNTGIHHRPFVEKEGLPGMKRDLSRVMLPRTEIPHGGIGEIHAVIRQGIGKDVQGIVSAGRLHGEVRGMREREEDPPVPGDLRHDPQRMRTDHNLVSRLLRRDFKPERLVRLEGEEIHALRLIEAPLMPRPAAVVGESRNPRRMERHRLTVDFHRVAVVGHVIRDHGTDSVTHGTPPFSFSEVRQISAHTRRTPPPVCVPPSNGLYHTLPGRATGFPG